MTEYTIYHNPRCSKSRQTLQLLQDKDANPSVVEYLKTSPTQTELKRIVKALGIDATALLRTKEALFREVCPDGNPSNAEAIRLMAEHPKLIERPIVVCGDQAVIGRPPENVLSLLNQSHRQP